MKTKMKCWMLLCVGLCAAAEASAQAPHPLLGKIWDAHARQFISQDVLNERVSAARYVLLGEKHDNKEHHARQLDLLKGLAAKGKKVAMAMEQFDFEHQNALTLAQSTGLTDAEGMADAGRLDRQGWAWPTYKDLLVFALSHQWPILAANLSRAEGRRIARGESIPTLPTADSEQLVALENDVVQGHCGYRPEPAQLAGMVAAQRGRDAQMARTLDAAPGAVVLIAGAGHVRSDRAVPRYLAAPTLALSVVMVEVSATGTLATDYDSTGYDVLWFTEAVKDQPDPCGLPLRGLAAPIPTNPLPP